MAELLRRGTASMEFFARVNLVNIPSYLLAHSPEVDRLCSMLFAYLTLQVVGLCWAFMVNASFSLALRITPFLPPESISGLPIQPDTTSLFASPESTAKLICQFYVSYASIRVVISFGQAVFQLALESIKDFPDAAKIISDGGIDTLKWMWIIFIPALLLELGLMQADNVCSAAETNGDSAWQTLSAAAFGALCHRTGLHFLTSQFPEIRRMIYYCLVCLVVQIWQGFLHQFPHWNAVFKEMPSLVRFLCQASVGALWCVTWIVCVLLLLGLVRATDVSGILHMALFGWTLWLFLLTPSLVTKYGASWADKATPQSMMSLAAFLRISHMCIIGIIFFGVCTISGFLRAQVGPFVRA